MVERSASIGYLRLEGARIVTTGTAARIRQLGLSEPVTASLRRAFEHLAPAGEDIEVLLAGLVGAAGQLPRDVIASLLAFRAAPDAPPAVLISGLPLDERLPATPVDPAGNATPSLPISTCAILLVAMLLGEPLAYAAEKGGALVQDVYPTRAEQRNPSNEASAVPLDFHTELTFSRAVPDQSFAAGAPDFVLLLALRSPPERAATTSIVDARDLCASVGSEHVALLREPRFQLRAPHSFTRDAEGSRPWSAPLALVRGPAAAPRVAFDIACGVRALSDEAGRALEALRAACADPALQHGVQLAPNQLLAIDNARCAHARGSFVAGFDGRDRWLRRVYVRRSLQGLVSSSEGSFRVLA